MWYSVSQAWQEMWSRALRGGWILAVFISFVCTPGFLLAQSPATVDDFEGEIIELLPQHIKADTAGQLVIDLQFPDGYHLNPHAPLHYDIGVHGEGIHIAEADRMGQMIAPPLPLVIPFQASAGTQQSTAAITMTFYYCRADDTGVCVIQSVRWQVPLHTAPEQATSKATVSYKAEVPVVHKQL